MAFEYITYTYASEQQFEKLFVYFASLNVSGYSRFYFATKRRNKDDWTYYGGTADPGFALDTGLKLTSYGAVEADAQTNYLRVQPDAEGKLLAVFPTHTLAKYVRIYIDTANDNPTQLYEFRPSTRLSADEIITGKLHITDQFTSPPQIVITASDIDRVKIGNVVATTYGIAGYDNTGATIFELTNELQKISGWTFTASEITNGGVSYNSNTGLVVATSSGILVTNGGNIRIEGEGGLYLKNASTTGGGGFISFTGTWIGPTPGLSRDYIIDRQMTPVGLFGAGKTANGDYGDCVIFRANTRLYDSAATTGIIIGENTGLRVSGERYNDPVNYLTLAADNEIDIWLGDTAFCCAMLCLRRDYFGNNYSARFIKDAQNAGGAFPVIVDDKLVVGDFISSTLNVASVTVASYFPDTMTIRGGLALYTTPATSLTATLDCGKLYVATTDGLLHYLDENGNDYDLTASGGGSGSMEPNGCQISNGTDTNHDIDITAGARYAQDFTTVMVLSSAITKRFDAAWAAGTGNGGMYGSSIPTSGTIHIYLIGKADGAADVMGSASASSPSLPSGYTLYCRIASIITNSSANILKFHQFGNSFVLDLTPMDVDSTTISTTPQNHTLSVPTGIEVLAHLNWEVDAQSGRVFSLNYPGKTDETPSQTAAPGGFVKTISGYALMGSIDCQTNTSGQVRSTANTLTNGKLRLFTRGWVDINLPIIF